MNDRGVYRLWSEGGRLILQARSFEAERGSVLHGGIYTRELSSSLVAAAAAGAVLVYYALGKGLGLVHYVAAVVVFVVLFPVARFFIFREPFAETVFDRDDGTVSITVRKPFGGRRIQRPLGSLRSVGVRHVRIEPENPDGVDFVKRIALQHGTVIPGFGEPRDFFILELAFDSEVFSVLTLGDREEAEDVAARVRSFIAAREA